MYAKTMTYETFDGEQITETFYFNLTKAELAEMQLMTDGGLETKIRRIVETKNRPELIKLFKDIILMSYGVKSDDGKRFIKSKELTEAFTQTEAYSDLFVELASKEDAATEFITNILPKELREQIAKQDTAQFLERKS